MGSFISYSRYISILLLFYLFDIPAVFTGSSTTKTDPLYLLDEHQPFIFNERRQKRLLNTFYDRIHYEDVLKDLIHEPPRRYYFFERELGRGGFGVVYRAFPRPEPLYNSSIIEEEISVDYNVTATTAKLLYSNVNPVAIKAIAVLGSVKGDKYSFNETGIKSIHHRLNITKSEITILKMLEHPNILKSHEAYIHNGVVFLVMEYVNQNSIKASEYEYNAPAIRKILLQLLSAVKYIHSFPNPIIHRDIKPANIIIDPKGKLKLIDFGIAKIKGVHKMTRGGTKGYRPKESYTLHQDISVDIYSIGILSYYLYFGEKPIVDEDTFEVIFDSSFDNRQYHSIMDLIDRCTIEDPTQRPTAQELLEHPFLHGQYIPFIDPCIVPKTIAWGISKSDRDTKYQYKVSPGLDPKNGKTSLGSMMAAVEHVEL
jgi:serine/threonine protein kinase